jgi:hypothetical protein
MVSSTSISRRFWWLELVAQMPERVLSDWMTKRILTDREHLDLAALLRSALENLAATARIVDRAAYTDRFLYVAGTVQEWLVDPLNEARREAGVRQDPYPSVGYGGPHRRKRPPAKRCVP